MEKSCKLILAIPVLGENAEIRKNEINAILETELKANSINWKNSNTIHFNSTSDLNGTAAMEVLMNKAIKAAKLDW